MAKVLRGDSGRVGFVELFFDLVFVFAITQVSHLLLHHLTLAGLLETTLIFLAVWWVWIYTTWVMNRLDPEEVRVRGLLFALMVAGLFLSMSIPEAFADRGMVFALAYVVMQLGRSLVMLGFGWGDPRLRRSYLRISAWMVGSGLFWVAGALTPPDQRLAIWTVALAIEYAGPVAGFWLPGMGRERSTDWEVRGGHMAERAGLFVIIALGETLLLSGATFAETEWTGPGMLAFLANVGITIGMWWVYFHIGHARGTHQIEHAADPGRIARLSFTYAHIPIVAGIVLAAVGAELAIAHPDQRTGHVEALVITGGTVLFIAGNGWFKRLSGRWFPLSHLVGLGLAVAAGTVSGTMPLSAFSLVMAAILAVVAVWEHRSLHGSTEIPPAP